MSFYRTLFLAFFLSLTSLVSAGDDPKIDSLLTVASALKSGDTNKLNVFIKISNRYLKKKDVSHALVYANMIYKEAAMIQSGLFTGHAYNIYGRIFELAHNDEVAKAFHLTSLKLFHEQHYERGTDAAYTNLARIYLRQKDYRTYMQYAFTTLLITYAEFKNQLYLMYTGFFLFFFLYNLFIYFFTKDKAYLYISYCIILFGLFNEFCRADHQFFREYPIFWQSFFFSMLFSTLLLACFFLSKYFIEILRSIGTDVQKEIKVLKRMGRTILFITASIVTLTLLYGILYKKHFDFWWDIFLLILNYYDELGMLILIIMLVYIIVVRYQRKFRNINYTVAGTFLLFAGVLVSELDSNLNGGIGFLNLHSFGACLFLLLLSVQVANKIEIFRREKETAQLNAMARLETLVEERTLQIKKQKALIEEKQHEILDSITYAKRLQEAILPHPEYINGFIPENFILYKPKDIVAGDFYWSETHSDNFFIAAADSTGHGVPGALVSVVCSNALNRALKEFNLTDPGKILDKTRELVLETFAKSASEVKDGMDISLLCINKKERKISWSGANNPVWYINREGFFEVKADKQPIGKTDYARPFTTHQILYSEGTIFYLFTDGLADQFGGPKGKKFKYKQFSDILVQNKDLGMAAQLKILEKVFSTWKGDLEQVDDVCVIGIKL
jgi:serine phosphatase RsbU (regulator of sigma subunit)